MDAHMTQGQDGVPSFESINIDILYQTYPKSNFPDTLKPPSAKSKLSKINDYERILDDYEEEANNVAFRISARLPFWIRALWVYLYDFIGDKRMYEVTWVDDPSRTNTQHTFIEVHSKSTTSTAGMMYKLTVFMKTGSVTVQGTNRTTFVNKHFKPLCTIVDMLERKFGTQPNPTPSDETLVKKPYQGSDKEQGGPPPTNDEGLTPSRIPVRKDQLSNSSITSSIIKEVKDTFQQMEQTFADSLAKFVNLNKEQLQPS